MDFLLQHEGSLPWGLSAQAPAQGPPAPGKATMCPPPSPPSSDVIGTTGPESRARLGFSSRPR